MAFRRWVNDIEMLQTVGFGVAMGNAHPDVKAAADYVCPAAWEDGIYRLTTFGFVVTLMRQKMIKPRHVI